MKFANLIWLLLALSFTLSACSSGTSRGCSADCHRQYTQADKLRQCLNMCH